jgi:hypothetical protein
MISNEKVVDLPCFDLIRTISNLRQSLDKDFQEFGRSSSYFVSGRWVISPTRATL